MVINLMKETADLIQSIIKNQIFQEFCNLTDSIKEIANELKVTLSQLVLNWTIQQPGITCALVGARNAAQVLDNVKAADFRLTSEEINMINKLLSNLKLETKI